MIRKTKLAIVVAGVLLLAGVAFGAPRPSKPIVLWTQEGFTCTSKVADANSRETAQYNANLAERSRLESRRTKLQENINILENTCDTLPRKQQATCRQGVRELKSLENRLDQINLYANLYGSCIRNDIAWSSPKTRLSFSPFRTTEKKTVVAGDTVLAEWTLTATKGIATIYKLNSQIISIEGTSGCNVFSSYEFQDNNGKVLSVARDVSSAGGILFDFSSPLVVNALPQKLKLVGKNFSGSTTPVTCQFEMIPTDVARSHLLVDSSYQGWGPFGYLYEVVSVTPTPSITILNPNGGETLKVGETYKITWENAGGSELQNVQISIMDMRYLIDDAYPHQHVIAYRIPNTGEFIWDVVSLYTPDLPDTNEAVYKLIVSGWGEPEFNDWSDDVFKITNSYKCGSAVNSIFSKEPVSNLCTSGNDVLFDVWFDPLSLGANGNGTWVWICGKGGGVNGGSYPSERCSAQSDNANVIYSWTVGSWGVCDNNSQTRSVACTTNFGKMGSDSYCTGVKPAVAQTCSGVTYSWYRGDANTCGSTCSTARTVVCQSNVGQTVVDSLCVGTKPDHICQKPLTWVNTDGTQSCDTVCNQKNSCWEEDDKAQTCASGERVPTWGTFNYLFGTISNPTTGGYYVWPRNGVWYCGSSNFTEIPAYRETEKVVACLCR